MSPFGKPIRGPHSPGNLPVSAFACGRKQAAIVAVLALLTLSASGCSVVHNGYSAMTSNGSWNQTVVVMRNRSYSAKAWHRRKQNFCNEKHNQDFCNGFRAGYEAVCGGADGCTPAFPPSNYWSWEYQSAEGQARTSSWFSGYPHGVRAAEEEGTANWHQIQMSAGMQSQLQSSGVLSHQGAVYPIPDATATGFVPSAVRGTVTPAPAFPSGLPSQGVVPMLP